MSLLRKILLTFFLLFPVSNSFAAMVTEVQNEVVADSGLATVSGIEFNKDGTKMFTTYAGKLIVGGANGDMRYINEYTLSTPFDISTKTYAGDGERCEINHGENDDETHKRYHDLEFSNDGLKIFLTSGNSGLNTADSDRVYRFDLTTPYDVSTCTFAQKTTDLDANANLNGSNAGPFTATNRRENRLQGVEINDDGTKLFLSFFILNQTSKLLEFNLSTPYDLTTMSINTNGGFETPTDNPMAIRFSANGKRIFIVDHYKNSIDVTQISLGSSYNTTSYTVDGQVKIDDVTSDSVIQLRAVGFSASGLKMFIANDRSNVSNTFDKIYEYDLVCPFNIIEGKCPSITENKDRTGMAIAQIEIAKRTIDQSTDTALNRLKWIRRNKDKQNLTNLNIDINFTNQRLASLTEVVRASAAKKKTKDKNKEEDIFYWSEGSIAVGRIGDTSISSTKKIDTDAITFGADKFTDDNGIKGLAFRVGRNNVDVGNAGSNLDTDTYNITYYSTSLIEDDTKFLDSIIGFGKLNSDLLTVQDGENLTANRSGHQIYGTIRIKDEIKKNNLTFIPSGRFDIGHTILGSYKEVGTGAIDVQKQHIRSKKIRAGLAAVEDISNDKYDIKRHGKIEYFADIDRSSNFKYTYVSDGSVSFNDTLHSEALHNINGEIGIDIVLPSSFSIFLIYERNQAINSGHIDKIHIAIGYLPNKETNFAFSIDGSDNFKSNYVLSKNINDYLIDFKLTNDLMKPEDYDEASFNLSRKF